MAEKCKCDSDKYIGKCEYCRIRDLEDSNKRMKELLKELTKKVEYDTDLLYHFSCSKDKPCIFCRIKKESQ